MPDPSYRRRGEGGCENLAGIEPACRWMGERQPEQSDEKGVCRFVLNEMVGQDPGRLVAVGPAAAARPQMPDEPAECGRFADKPAIAAPGDEIDMDIGREHARRRPRRRTRVDPRDRADAAGGEERQKRIGEAVPRRRQDGERAGAEQRASAAPVPSPDRRRFPSGERDGGNSLFLLPLAWST